MGVRKQFRRCHCIICTPSHKREDVMPDIVSDVNAKGAVCCDDHVGAVRSDQLLFVK